MRLKKFVGKDWQYQASWDRPSFSRELIMSDNNDGNDDNAAAVADDHDLINTRKEGRCCHLSKLGSVV